MGVATRSESDANSLRPFLYDITPTISCLTIGGSDALDLLNRLSASDLSTVSPNRTTPAVFTEDRGRVVALTEITQLATGQLLITNNAPDPQPLLEHLNKYIIIEDVELQDSSTNYAAIALSPASDELTRQLNNELPHAIIYTPAVARASAQLKNVLVAADQFEALKQLLTARGFRQLSDADYQEFRIEHGIPVAPNELSDTYNPLELKLADHISFTKGCYVGQEVIARLDTYAKVQRNLVRLTATGPLTDGEKLYYDKTECGLITSVARRADGTSHALGFIKLRQVPPGTEQLRTETTTVTIERIDDGPEPAA